MKIKPPRIRISERQQVLLIIPFAIIVMLTIWFWVLSPQFERRREIAELRRQLEKSAYAHVSMEQLKAIEQHEKALGARLDDEWARTVLRLATFENQHELRESEFGRIDYKMELYQTRLRLSRRSEELGIPLIPQDLGLQDTLGGKDAEVRIRMLQLRAVEKLVDLTLNRRIQKLHAIHPLAPVTHPGPNKKLVLSEYPVQAEFDVGFDNLYLFFQAVFEQNQIFVFRNLRIEAGPTQQAPLRVSGVMSALLFE
jgi:hypothetical protein